MGIKNIVICILLTLLNSSCNNGKYSIYLISRNSGKIIKKGDPVCMNGFKIGMVSSMSLQDSDLIYEIKIYKKYNIPFKSLITITSLDFFKTSNQIDIQPSKEVKYYTPNDTIICCEDKLDEVKVGNDSLQDIEEATDTLIHRILRRIE